MGIFDLFGKKDSSADLAQSVIYKVSTDVTPYRLSAKTKSSVTLRVRVNNMSKDILLTSVVAELPGRIAFDEMMISRQREVKMGEVQPGEEKEVKFLIYSGVGSDAGEYTVGLTAIAHYRDYGHVLNAVKKRVQISVV